MASRGRVDFAAIRLLTFSINVILDGCVDHQEGIADDETHAFFTRLMDEAGGMLWGRVTYEMMESYWPAVARGDEAHYKSIEGVFWGSKRAKPDLDWDWVAMKPNTQASTRPFLP